jgi:hypothetical protein
MRADRVLNQSHTAATPRDSVPVPVVRAGGGYRYLLEVATTLAEQFVVLPPRGRGAHRAARLRAHVADTVTATPSPSQSHGDRHPERRNRW